MFHVKTLALLSIVVALVAVIAQTTDAVLTGNVIDSTGGAIAGAVVSAINTNTGVALKTITNDSGVYIFPGLPPGLYRVSVERSGFRRSVIDEVELAVAAQRNLNATLEVGSTAETVEVRAAGGTELGYLTSSVGSVMSGRKVLELPLSGRSAYDLLSTQAGVTGPNGGQNLNGARVGSMNVSVDGTNIQDNLLNSLFLTSVVSSIPVDRIEEFRIVTAPADAELGRGSGQIQAITRGGTNQFHGSLFEEVRNTLLTADSFFNNTRGQPRDFLIRNQYGGRVGGPVRKNKTFFNFYYEARRERLHVARLNTVYTQSARQGLFRYYPGVRNGNANSAVPTVDLSGNPVKPAGASGDLQTVSVFNIDPSRLTADKSGVIAQQLSLTPLPNNYTVGDGLNTAGFSWSRSRPVNFGQYDIRLDHQFTSSHRLSYTFSHQNTESFNFIGTQNFPTVPAGGSPNWTTSMAVSLTSTLRPTLLNEFRAGLLRPTQTYLGPWQVGGTDVLPKTSAGLPYLVSFANVDSPMYPSIGDDPSSRISPVYQYSDTMTWLHGRHSFKGGGEVRFVSSAGYDSFNVMPRATLGAGAVPVQNFAGIPGIGLNQGAAQQMLTDLAGSLNGAAQTFNSPGGTSPSFIPGLTRYQHIRQPEFDWFFKDDFKVTPHLTLNLGLRYEWYAVPKEVQGRGSALVGGSAGIFGISGTSFADLFQPGVSNGSLTQVQGVGPGTSNPGVPLYQNDNNNFAPAVGLSWSLPWFGENKTVLRMGYGVGYERNPIYLTSTVSGQQPGFSTTTTFVTASLLTTGNLVLPLPATVKPLQTVPVTDPGTTVYSYDNHLRTPYYQNFNVTLQRQLRNDTVLEVRWVGNKGTRLIRDANINEANIFENGILDAFRVTQAGGNSPLLDKLFNGLSVSGLGVVNGTTITGSDAVRSNNGGMQGFLTSNNVGGFANFLATTNQFTGARGGLPRRIGLPANWVFANPQFATADLVSNYGSSTYHSGQVEIVKRFTSGWTLQANYTFSKVLGDYEGDGSALGSDFRTLRDRNEDKRVLNYSRAHVFKSNGIYELPFGPGKTFGRGVQGWGKKVLEGWQVGAIYLVSSGQPISLSAVNAFNTFGGATPVAAAAVSKNLGSVQRTGNGVLYFSGLKQVPDPYIANITTINGIQSRSGMLAIADASGRLLLVNPAPGQFGTVAPNSLEGPGSYRLDLNLIKRFKISEKKEFYLRADAVNATNHASFSNPDTNINSTTFGRITSTSADPRVVVLSARFSF